MTSVRAALSHTATAAGLAAAALQRFLGHGRSIFWLELLLARAICTGEASDFAAVKRAHCDALGGFVAGQSLAEEEKNRVLQWLGPTAGAAEQGLEGLALWIL